jgi:mannose PTS system EIIA component
LVGIVLVSHGLLADGMKNAVEMIVGPQTFFLTIGMEPETELADVRNAVEAAVLKVTSDGGVLVLVDILGGNPANASSRLASHGTTVICGVNLPMLLELLIQRENCTLRELTTLAIQAAKEGVINLTQQIAQHD